MLKVALIGRPNVGKSTLFNALIGDRRALVADEPGVTRDRHYGVFEHNDRRCLLIDTGGVTFGKQDLERLVFMQTDFAIREADVIGFMVDARTGMTALDQEIIAVLRRADKEVWLLINKVDNADTTAAHAEFAQLGLDKAFCMAANRGYGIKDLRAALAERGTAANSDGSDKYEPNRMRVTFLGRPNAGKSTLINCILGEQRLLSFDAPGTTRDSVAVDFTYDGTEFSLVDTAGIRRRKLADGTEKLSVLKALENATLSDVAVLVCDAEQGVSSQDATLAARVLEAGCALIVAVNKSDLITEENRLSLQRSMDLRLQFLTEVPTCFVSGLHKRGIRQLLKLVRRVWKSARVQLATPKCTRLLHSAVEQHQPPLASGKRVKLRYAHQGGTCPPRFIVYGSRVEHISPTYRRYLQHYFCENLGLVGTPVVVEFRSTANPYARPS